MPFAERRLSEFARRAAGHELLAIAFEQVDHRRLHAQRLAGDARHLLDQHLGIARVDRDAAEAGQMLAVARPLQRLLDARIGPDAAYRRDHQRNSLALQRTQRDLDHHLAAVLALGHQLHLRPHRARAGSVRIGLPVGRVARPDAVGNERVHREARHLAGAIPEQRLHGRIGHHDDAALVHHQQAVGIGGEQRAEDVFGIDAGRQRRRDGGLCRDCHRVVTVGRKT